jgi:ABC-type sugar transport system ATPase subunit
MSTLDIQNLSKSYGERLAVDDVSFAVNEGELVCVVGPSGCGKTTLLRCIAGLLGADSGQIILAGQVVFSAEPRISTRA